MKPKRRYLWALSLVSLILIVLHAIEDRYIYNGIRTLKIDSTTLGLLAFAALPVIWEIVDTVKAGGVEISFKQFAVQQQLFTFLEGLAAKYTWTFYPPRQDESPLGQGLGLLIEKLREADENDLIKHLETWLKAENHNVRWFAAEIIGYFKISELKERLRGLLPNNQDANWEPWQLNSLWAYSRFHEYAGLKDFLLKTKSEFNLGWVLHVYSQMALDERENRSLLTSHVEEFITNRNDITDQLKHEANKVVTELRNNRTNTLVVASSKVEG
jgi:hypothetical protein